MRSTAVRTRRILLAAVSCLCVAGCLPEERLNDACRWTADAPLPPPGDPARRAHLIEDVRIAEALGIRHGDAVGGHNGSEWSRQRRESCTTAGLQEIARRHGVTRAEIAAVTGARELWIDLLVVLLPAAALFVAVSRRVVGQLVDGYAPEDRWVLAAVLAVVTPIAAGLALALAQMWGWTVETWRVRDGHISYRVFRLPTSRHGWLLWAIAAALFAGVAMVAVLRRGRLASYGAAPHGAGGATGAASANSTRKRRSVPSRRSA
jgi:hypothetical protein